MATSERPQLLAAGSDPRTRTSLWLESIALRHQIAVLKRNQTCVRRIADFCGKSAIRHTQAAGAAMGGSAGGFKRRDERMQQQNAQQHLAQSQASQAAGGYQRAMAACLDGRG